MKKKTLILLGFSALFFADVQAQTLTMVKDIYPTGDSGLKNLTLLNGDALFVANDGVSGRELWKTDGTTGGTVLLVYFRAKDGVSSAELWKTNGTAAGTVKITDASLQIMNPLGNTFGFVEINNELFFSARYNLTGDALWKLGGLVGVETLENNVGIKLYPNPAHDVLTIDSDSPIAVSLMNIHGQVLNTFPNNVNHQVDLSNLSQGIYLISVNQGQQVHRFVKE